jgi:hypothetical protein
MTQDQESKHKHSYSDEWRLECEAREVLSWKLEKRRKFLIMVEKERGKAGREKLEGEILRLWNLKKSTQ